MIDINVWTGYWNTLIVKGDVETVRRTVQAYGVAQIFMAPLDAAWCPDPHLYNEVVYKASDRYDDIFPVPIIDPTLPTWQKELNRAAACTGVRLIKLLPGYGGYDLSKTDDFFTSVCEAKLGVMIQVRIDDPRHQHPLAQAPDVPASSIAAVADRHPDVTIIIGGASTSTIHALKEQLITLPNLHADTSQLDGLDAIKILVEDSLLPKLIYGSHAPLFMPAPSIARILNDLDDESAMKIMRGNGERILNYDF